MSDRDTHLHEQLLLNENGDIGTKYGITYVFYSMNWLS